MEADRLYQHYDTAEKFRANNPGVPEVNRAEQSQLGMEWAARQANRPAEKPIQPMVPINPVAS